MTQVEIKKMPPLRRTKNGVIARKSKYRFSELEVGEGYELPDDQGTFVNSMGYTVSKRKSRVQVAANQYSKRNNVKISVAVVERDGQQFIAVRRDA